MRIHKRKRRASVVSLTSLIDVIFLLLLFFMLSSTFSKFSIMDLGVASSGGNGKVTPKLILRLDKDKQIFINGRLVVSENLNQKLSEFVEKGADTAIIQARKDVSVQEMVSFLERLKTSPLKSVTLAP